MILIDITNQQFSLPIDELRLREAVRRVLHDAAMAHAQVSVAVVDDPTIHGLNRQYLDHDYPTDVLSFVLDEGDGRLEGEIIVSADTAVTSAPRYGWPAEDELLLYVIHGALHLVGYRDGTPGEQAEMRRCEAACLACFGLEPHATEPARATPRGPRRAARGTEGKSTS